MDATLKSSWQNGRRTKLFLLWVSLHALPTMLAKLIIPRTAIAIYLGLLGDGMSQFTFVMSVHGKFLDAITFQAASSKMREMEDVNRKFKRRRNNGTSDGEE